MGLPFEEVRALDAREVCERLGLERYAKERRKKYRCPACNTGGLHIYSDGLHCHSCKLTGTVDVVMVALELDAVEACKWLAEQFGVEVDATPSIPVPPPFRKPEKRDAHDTTVLAAIYNQHDLGQEARDYLESRGIDAALCEAVGIVSVEDELGWHRALGEFTDKALMRAGLKREDTETEEITTLVYAFPFLLLPYFDAEGALCSLRFAPYGPARERERRKYFSLYGGNPPTPFMAHNIEAAKGGTLYIAEGELNALSLADEGLLATSSVGAGGWQRAWTERLEGVERVVVVADGDEERTGFAARIFEQMCELFGMAYTDRHLEVVISSPGKDANDFHKQGLLLDYLEAGSWEELEVRVEETRWAKALLGVLAPLTPKACDQVTLEGLTARLISALDVYEVPADVLSGIERGTLTLWSLVHEECEGLPEKPGRMGAFGRIVWYLRSRGGTKDIVLKSHNKEQS